MTNGDTGTQTRGLSPTLPETYTTSGSLFVLHNPIINISYGDAADTDLDGGTH